MASTLTDQQLQDFRRLRENFRPYSADSEKLIAFYCCPKLANPRSTNTQSLPTPSAERLADVSDDELRGIMALSFLRVGLGIRKHVQYQGKDVLSVRAPGNLDDPPGRQGAYLDVVAPFETPSTARLPWVGDDDDSHGKSSCGLFIRAMWQLLGGGQPAPGQPEQQFRSNYVTNTVFKDIEDLAAGYGAVSKPPFKDPRDELRLGDVLIVNPKDGKGQHIFAVAWLGEPHPNTVPVGRKGAVLVYSVDGGNGSTGDGGTWQPKDPKSGDGPCIGITSFERLLTWNGFAWDIGKYNVGRHIKLAPMRASFTEPWILPYTPWDIHKQYAENNEAEPDELKNV
jgi:hypothetical protein